MYTHWLTVPLADDGDEFLQVIEEKRHGERAVKFYDKIDKLQKAEKKRYDDFVGKGIEIHEERSVILGNNKISD